jgi:hypothetical protein
MFIHINDPFLSENLFEKVYIVDCAGNYSIYYYKQGIYLKFLSEHFYAVYNDDMQLLGTTVHSYPMHILLIMKNHPLHMN